jgi:cytochrome c oxidase cbb3-type subunit I/II
MVRPFRSETERYGEYSKAGEFVYDHPFQWGSKRTGPDLAREGVGNNKKSDGWHFRHLREPSSMSEGSVMPTYAFMIEKALDTRKLESKISAMRTLGVPYAEGYEKVALSDLEKQAQQVANNLKADNIEVKSDREVIALIAYLQRLGVDITKENKTAEATSK